MDDPAVLRPLWRQPQFRSFWLGRAVSATGSGVTATALPIIAVTLLHGSAFMLGILAALPALPALVLGIPTGVWMGRQQRLRRVMIGSELLAAAAIAAIPGMAVIGALSFPILFTATALASAGNVTFGGASAAQMPLLVTQDQMTTAVARFSLVNSIRSAGGPSLASGVVAALTAPVALLVDVASYLVSVLTLLRLDALANRPPPGPQRSSEGVVRAYVAGLREIMSGRSMRSLTVLYAGALAVTGAVLALYPVLALRNMSLSSSEYAATVAMLGVGGILAGFAVPPLIAHFGERAAVLCGVLAFPLLAGGLAGIGGRDSRDFIGGLLIWLLVGLLSPSLDIVISARVYRAARPDTVAGVMNTVSVIATTGRLLGALIAGAIGAAVGVRYTMALVALVAMLLPVGVSVSAGVTALRTAEVPTEPSRATQTIRPAAPVSAGDSPAQNTRQTPT